MDELTLLRRLDVDAAAPGAAATDAARAALARAMDGAEGGSGRHVPTRRRKRMRRRGWVAASAGVATALTATLVLTDVVGLAGLGGGASAEATELLNKAAADVIRTKDPVVRPGEFLLVITHSVNETTGDDGAGGDVAYPLGESSWLFIPADEHDVWTEVRGLPHSAAGAYYGTDARAIAEQQDRQMQAENPKPQVVRGRDGTQWGAQPRYTPSSLAGLPRDPRVLLNHIYRVTFGHGQSRDGEALVWIADLLRTGFVPADLRAALYRAATMIPGVTVTDHAATLDGHDGVAIGRIEGTTGVRQDVIIDPDTGLLIGEREVTTRPIDFYAAGITLDWTAVRTTVERSVDPSIWAAHQ